MGAVKEVVKGSYRVEVDVDVFPGALVLSFRSFFSQQAMTGFHKVTPLPLSVYHPLPHSSSTFAPSHTPATLVFSSFTLIFPPFAMSFLSLFCLLFHTPGPWAHEIVLQAVVCVVVSTCLLWKAIR